MKKRDLTRLVLTGIASGLLASNLSLKAQDQNVSSDFLELVANSGGNITYHLLTEDEMLLELNEEGAELFKSLSPEGKQLALRIASRSCNNTNDCKGENACRTDKNKCAGQGQCKGQTKCAFSDKNLAVKVAAKKMAEKRNQALEH
jgi:hypothetical protein